MCYLLHAVLTTFFTIVLTQSLNMAAESTKVHQNLSASCAAFSKVFYKELYVTSEENIVSSPLSIHMILSLLSHGAKSETLNALSTSLYHHDKNMIKEGYADLVTVLNELKNITLHVANAIYIQEEFELLPEFLEIGTNTYKSVISKLDFKHKKEEAADEINKWVEQITHHKISGLVSSDDFDEFSKLVLVNAIYFSGMWLKKFDVDQTQKKIFHTARGEKKMVTTMFKKSRYNYGEIPLLDAKFIEIPYMNEDIVMTVLVPNEVDGLTNLQNKFSWEVLANASRKNADISLYLPRFEIEFTVDLDDILRKLGLENIFEDEADFGDISNIPLKVSKVVHKAVIKVSEEGTEAAAATAVHMRLKRSFQRAEQFLVDRPFMFIIEHKPNNIPLFIGNVKDLESESKRDEL
ncbi:leukocyte elastase inhibitor isoform X1 [Nomia melanderi]|uniref:leukocyte elastase inhibitor isoform X1 n=2 Tax=Nomia melanderi TaxID=2448451 RepID=UPI003FCE0A06